jgi:hypothetical protein
MKLTYPRLSRIAITFAAILIILSCSKDEVIEQIVANSDFTSGSASPDAWFYYGNGSGHEHDWTKKTGTSDYCISIAGAFSIQQISYWYQNFLGIIPRGKTLTLKAKIKAEDLSGQGASIAVRCDGDTAGNLAFSTSQGKSDISGTFEWKEFTVTLDKVPENTRSIIIFLIYLPNTTGKVSFDDVILTYKN